MANEIPLDSSIQSFESLVTDKSSILHDEFHDKKHNFPTIKHPKAINPLRNGATLDASSLTIINNVYHYLSEICLNPKVATATACGVSRHTVNKAIIKSSSTANNESTILSAQARDDNDQPCTSESLEPSRKRSKRGKKPIHVDSFYMHAIYMIVHQKLRNNESPTLDNILETVKDRFPDQFPYGRTTLHKIMHTLGFIYKQRGVNMHLLYARKENVHWRARYLRAIKGFRMEGRTLIYLDETWYNCNDCINYTWHDINVERNPWRATVAGSGLSLGLNVPSGRGKRLMITNAISKDGSIKNALWVFNSNSTILPEDYHHDMDAHNFEIWFQTKLLPNIPPDSVVVLDNASYHSRKSVKLPSAGRKADVIAQLNALQFPDFLNARGKPSDLPKMTLKVIFSLCKEYRDHFDKYAVDEMAKQAGHTVLRLPPYHCFFNPIEHLWSYQKHLLRKSVADTSLKAIQEACERCFSQIPTNGLGPYFEHIEKVEAEHWRIDGLTAQLNPPVIIPLASDSENEDDVNIDATICVSDNDDDIEY